MKSQQKKNENSIFTDLCRKGVKPNQLNPKIRRVANQIRDRKLRTKVCELLADPSFEVNGKVYSGSNIESTPAGLSHHHSYSTGLLEHILSTAKLAIALCDSTETVYHGKVDRDVVIAGVLLHDVFKTLMYKPNRSEGYVSTDLADRLDHLSIATAELVRRGFPLDLVHIVSSHHGEYGPIRPRTIEALICHLADLTDSRFDGELLSAAGYLIRKATGTELRGLTSEQALAIIMSKASKGFEGVVETVDRISEERTRKN
jgi:7,8-dihydroneopterin 2',3'-cyclic phosphate phosphodiesterase